MPTSPAACRLGLLSVIIPVFNEAQNVTLLYEALQNTLPGLGCPYEVIIVNDGSTDSTPEKLDELAASDPHWKVIHFVRNYGQTAAIMAGIDHASGDIIIPMDGDLQNDPSDIPKLLARLDEGYDVCSGWRKHRQDNTWSRTIPSKIANRLISHLTKVHLHDYGCTLKAYRRNVLKGVKLYGEMHRFIPIYASWQGAKVTEEVLTHHPRRFGRSKYGIERTVKVLLDLILIQFMAKYAQKPIYVFGSFSLFSFLISGITTLYAFWLKFVEGISFIITPLPLLAVMTFFTGVICMLMGLLAEIINRTYYESQGKDVYQILVKRNFEDSTACAASAAS